MGYTEYTLPTINNNACGVVKWYLYVNDGLPVLTVPTKVNIMNMGDIVEKLDAIAGTLELDNVDIDIAEDYSFYSNGFWHHLINDFPTDFDIMFTLMEGSDEVYVFRGTIFRKEITETEHYLDIPDAPTKAVRGLKFKLVSPLIALNNVPIAQTGYVTLVTSYALDDNNFKNIPSTDILTIGGGDCTIQPLNRGFKISLGDPITWIIHWRILNAGTSYVDGQFTTNADSNGNTHTVDIKTVTADLCTEILTHKEAGGYISDYSTSIDMIQLKAVFATMINLAYGDSYDVSMLVDNTTDLQVYDNISAYEGFSNLYMATSFFDKTLNGDGSTVFYGAYSGRFKTVWELFKHLCKQFGAIPEYSFGTVAGLIDSTPANNKHRIILKSRGRSGATVTMSGKISSSQFISNSSYISRNIRIKNFFHDEWSCWCEDDKILTKTTAAAVSFKDKIYDIEIESDFFPTNDLTGYYEGFQQVAEGSLFVKMSAGQFSVAMTVRWWNYTTSAWIVYNVYGWVEKVQVVYFFHRMRDGRVQYIRKYRSLLVNDESTNSIRNNKTCMRHTINDGTITRTFYATELGKSLFENRTSTKWAQE